MQLPTERLILREFVESDWPAVHEYGSDPEVVRYMLWGPNTEADTRAFIGRALASQREEPRRNYEMAVVLQDGGRPAAGRPAGDGRLIGGCGLNLVPPANRAAMLGYCYHRAHWGSGYATEAARALVAFGFGRVGLHRIWATCDTDNAASAHVLEKLGMQREGRLRDDVCVRGRWRDSLLYAVLEDEWRAEKDPSRGP